MSQIKLTGVSVGDAKKGYTAFFREIPFVSAEGATPTDAQNNLLETIAYASESIKEEMKNDGSDRRGYLEFNANLALG